MPELNHPLGYPLVIGFMVLSVGLLLFYYRRKGWLGE
jgi:Mg2+ and Co2+ transporter CorA